MGSISSFLQKRKHRSVNFKYASEHGVAKAARHFKEKGVKESTIRDWRRAYEREVSDNCKTTNHAAGEVVVTALSGKRRGRPPILGINLDKKLQEKILLMRDHQAAIGSSIVVGLGRGLLLKYNKASLDEFGGPIKLSKEWAHSVLQRMGFSKRRANSKSKLTPANFEEIKEQYLVDIHSVVKMEEIPDTLVINWDQTAMKIVPS